MAASTMKGLLKGLRYISQMFDGSEEEEPEMQIGNPTDVKHVAHIGWDGPAVQNSPSWMDGFNPPKETSSAPLTFPDNPNARPLSEDSSEGSKSGEKKHSRRRHSTSGTIDGQDIRNEVKPRRHNHHSSLELDTSSTIDVSSPPSIPKKSRKKKSKDSSVGGEGSSGKSRTKGHKKSDSSGIPSPKPKSKSKDMDCPTAAMKGMGLDEKMDSAAGCRQVLEL